MRETDWLGYWLCPHGLKPWKKKIEAILKLQPPTSIREVRSFIGAINFYRDMFPRRAHLLASLTQLTGKGNSPFIWTTTHQQAFDSLKSLIVRDCMTHYPDHNLPFDIYTDASDLQLGAVIMQNNRPVAYFSRKLNPGQQKYSTLEKELLSIFETFKEFQSMLLGANITVYTDHRNLTFPSSVNQRVLRQLSFCDQFHPTYPHIPGGEELFGRHVQSSPHSQRVQ